MPARKTATGPALTIIWQAEDAGTQLAQVPPHETALKTAPKITKSKITSLIPIDGIVLEVLNKACPTCGGSLWWSKVPRFPQDKWEIGDFQWHCALGDPPPWSEATQLEVQAKAERDVTVPSMLPCRHCGQNPVRQDKPPCMGLCFVCSVQQSPLVRAHAQECLRCRDSFFPGWRERVLEKMYG